MTKLCVLLRSVLHSVQLLHRFVEITTCFFFVFVVGGGVRSYVSGGEEGEGNPRCTPER